LYNFGGFFFVYNFTSCVPIGSLDIEDLQQQNIVIIFSIGFHGAESTLGLPVEKGLLE